MVGNISRGSNRPDPDDALKRVARGDRSAFVELFASMAPKVKAYLIKLGSDPAAAEDITQDVMVTVWRKADQFDASRASAATWIFVIARNRRVDFLRRESSDVTYGQVPPERADGAELADEIVARGQDDALVRKTLDALPAEQQEVVRRSFFQDEPHAAIAAALGLPLGTVKSRLRLAFQRLRTSLEELP
jgi:RNA polymerase sigma-70 factor (ECF subfamily)